jgi:hypothetical protein
MSPGRVRKGEWSVGHSITLCDLSAITRWAGGEMAWSLPHTT